MLISVLIFTLVGSFVSSLVPNGTMGGFFESDDTVCRTEIYHPSDHDDERSTGKQIRKQKIQQSILCGVVIGFICGFVGAGGGMMLLLVLTSVLGYELKTAVGTSVFIMTFTALTGAIFPFLYRRRAGHSNSDCLCHQYPGLCTDWSEMGQRGKCENAEPRDGNFALCAGAGDAVFLTTSTDTLEVSKYDLTKSRKSLASMVKNNKQRIGLRISAAI